MSAPNKSYDPVEVTALSPAEVDRALESALTAIAAAATLDELKEARLAHSGDKAPLTLASAEIGALPPEARADAGRRTGAAKARVKNALAQRQAQLERERDESVLITEKVDVTLPGGAVYAAKGRLRLHTHRDLMVAVGEAFDAARRQIADYVVRRRGD